MVIGICGGSGSGKTTIIEEIMNLMKEHHPALLSLDNYYRDISEQAVDENGKVNFDLPDAIDSDQFVSDLKKLISGEDLRIKKYTFNVHRGENQYLDIPYSKIILTEGIFLFHIPEAMKLIDLKIYVELDHDLQLQRRLERDVKERGYDQNDVLYQWHHHVLPAYEKYIRIHKDEADIVILNDGDFNHLIDQVDVMVLNHPKIVSLSCGVTE